MSLQRFEILFDDPNHTYYTGQLVTGHVVLYTAKEKKIRGIRLHLKGEAQVHWTESRSETKDGKSETVYDSYSAHEMYANMELWLMTAPSGEMILPCGEHVFPFSYNLPVNIPSSFEGTHGYIRYTVKAIIDRPWRFDHASKVAFTVLNPLDLNLENNMQEPIQEIKEKSLCCCCCRSGPITVVVNVLRGFVPGQRIEAIIECDNVSQKEVTVQCFITKKVIFRDKWSNHTKQDENKVALERLGTVGPNDSHTWTSHLLVPPLPASYLKYCNCIDISYHFVVKAIIPGFHIDLCSSVPIVIGTIPLRNYFPAIVSPSAPPAPGTPPPYPDAPPPSYEECMLMKGNIRNEEDGDHLFGPIDFTPRYPTYNFK